MDNFEEIYSIIYDLIVTLPREIINIIVDYLKTIGLRLSNLYTKLKKTSDEELTTSIIEDLLKNDKITIDRVQLFLDKHLFYNTTHLFPFLIFHYDKILKFVREGVIEKYDKINGSSMISVYEEKKIEDDKILWKKIRTIAQFFFDIEMFKPIFVVGNNTDERKFFTTTKLCFIIFVPSLKTGRKDYLPSESQEIILNGHPVEFEKQDDQYNVVIDKGYVYNINDILHTALN